MTRTYAAKASAEEIFHWLSLVARVAVALPDEPETHALVRRWSALLDAHVAGKLKAGEVVMKSSEARREDWQGQVAKAMAAIGLGES